MPFVVAIPDDWFSHDFSGALFCPQCNEQTTWEEIYIGTPSNKEVLMFKCAKCHLITRQLPVRKKG